jgi:hypothetical protein
VQRYSVDENLYNQDFQILSGSTAAVMAQRRGPKLPRGGDFDDGSPEEPLRRKPGRRPIAEMQAEDESSLYFIIRNGKASLQVTYETRKILCSLRATF